MTDCFKRRKKQLNFIIPLGARAKINRETCTQSYRQTTKKNRPLLKTASRSNFSVFLHLLFEINPVAFLFEPSWRAADLSSFHQPAHIRPTGGVFALAISNRQWQRTETLKQNITRWNSI